jgi:hypothetical protein
MKTIAMASKMLAIVAGVIAVAGIFAAYAIIGAGKDITNGNGITVNEQKRGKGTVDTLSFKNPVTIRLIDKNGNVASETVVYNDIVDGGRNAIYAALESGSTPAINGMASIDATSGNVVITGVFAGSGGNPTTINVADGVLDCTPTKVNAPTINHGVTCTVTFDIDDFTTGASGGTINLDSGRKLVIGDVNATVNTVTSKYFEIGSSDFGTLNVAGNTTIATIQVSWRVSIP